MLKIVLLSKKASLKLSSGVVIKAPTYLEMSGWLRITLHHVVWVRFDIV